MGGHQGGPQAGLRRPRGDAARGRRRRGPDAADHGRAVPLGLRRDALAISGSGLAAAGIAASGTPEQTMPRVPECFGDAETVKLGANAVTEPQAGSDVKSLKTTAVRDGDEWVLNGTKVFITDADRRRPRRRRHRRPGPRHPRPGFVRDREGDPGAVPGQEGVEARDSAPRTPPRSCLMTAGSRPRTCSAATRSCSASWSAGRSGQKSRAGADALATFEITRPIVGASALGIAQAAYEWTLEYLYGREESGVPLLKAQRVLQTLADVATEIESARLLVQRASWMGRTGRPMTGGQGSMSKLKAGDVTMWATTTLMDLVGPAAWDTDHPLEKWFRDAKIYQLFEGTAEIQRMVISRMQALATTPSDSASPPRSRPRPRARRRWSPSPPDRPSRAEPPVSLKFRPTNIRMLAW